MFCDKCGSILVPGGEGFECPRCGWKGGDVDLSMGGSESKEVFLIDESKDDSLPKYKIKCRKCGNNEAFYFVYQTRRADEAPTTFYTCTKCGNKWREY